jgi:hypothetical protein
MAAYNGNVRTSPARPDGGDEQCEGNIRGPAAAASPSPPVVTLISPPEGTPLRAGDSVTFDVTDDSGFSLVGARVLFVATGERDAAYDRDDPQGAWDPRYAGSTIAAISGGWRLVLRRRGGWPGGGIRLLPRVVDDAGLLPS